MTTQITITQYAVMEEHSKKVSPYDIFEADSRRDHAWKAKAEAKRKCDGYNNARIQRHKDAEQAHAALLRGEFVDESTYRDMRNWFEATRYLDDVPDKDKNYVVVTRTVTRWEEIKA